MRNFRQYLRDLRTLHLHQRKAKGELERVLSLVRSGENLLDSEPESTRREWQSRIDRVCASSDNELIARHPESGTIHGESLVMHNGLLVHPLSYYGAAALQLLLTNRGVHEPEEERVFQEMLPCFGRGSTMVELGCYWAFYSMWFHSQVEQARCILVEPNIIGIHYGKVNFQLNHMRGTFIQKGIGMVEGFSVDQLVSQFGLQTIDLLHSDIQGAEYEMLRGARGAFDQGRVRCCFISTHSDELHEKCLSFLEHKRMQVVRNVPMGRSSSIDGLIVAKHPDMQCA